MIENVPDRSKGLWGRCKKCAHCWVVAYYPDDMKAMGRKMRGAKCPKCGTKAPWVAKQDNGVLLEQS